MCALELCTIESHIQLQNLTSLSIDFKQVVNCTKDNNNSFGVAISATTVIATASIAIEEEKINFKVN